MLSFVFNDKNYRVNGIFRYLQTHTTDQALDEIYNYIDKYKLTRANEEGFKDIRRDYNQSTTEKPMMLYTLVAYSYNQQLRFNIKGEFNSSFGRNYKFFSDSMREHLIEFKNRLDNMDAKFIDKSFDQVTFSDLDKNSFVYADPPYLITDATYNKSWDIAQENKLYRILDGLDEHNIKFGLSNVLTHKGKENKTLIEWSKNYNVHHLNYSYANSSYNTKRAASNEVLITNY